MTPVVAVGSDRAQARSVTPEVEAGGHAGPSEASAARSAPPAAPGSEDELMPEADADQPVKAEPGLQSQGPLRGILAKPDSSNIADPGVEAAALLHSPGGTAGPDEVAAATAAPAQAGPDGASAPAELDPVVQPGFQVEVEEPLGWVPPTCAAVSLRLFALDAALVYQPGQPPARERHQVGSVLCLFHAMLRVCCPARMLPAPTSCPPARAGHAPLQDLPAVIAGLNSWLQALSKGLALTMSPALQAYHYMQRPAPVLSTMGLHGPGGDFRMLDPAGRVVSGAPIALGSSRMKAVLFPNFAVST